MRVLIAEDEPRMLQLLQQGLREHGHAVVASSDGDAALDLAMRCGFDVLILDVGLPGRDGYSVARALRASGARTPILMLTAFDREDDIVRGLNLGADDYLTKPFSFPELLARLRSIARADAERPPEELTVDTLVLHPVQYTASRAGFALHLTRSEFLLLLRLMQDAPKAVSRQALMDHIWGTERHAGRGTLDTLMNGLRRKVDTPFDIPLIQTVRGSGYRVGQR